MNAGEALRLGEGIHWAVAQASNIARRKRGRGLGARKRRMREAKAARVAHEAQTRFSALMASRRHAKQVNFGDSLPPYGQGYRWPR